jgi:hypothetical protein
MKPDPRLEAHLIHCKNVAEDRRRTGKWPWDEPEITEDDYTLSQDTVDGVAELVAVLQSVWREAGLRPPRKSDHENNCQTKTSNANGDDDRH